MVSYTVWIASLLLYSKVKANIFILKILKFLQGFQILESLQRFQVKIQDVQQFIDLSMLY